MILKKISESRVKFIPASIVEMRVVIDSLTFVISGANFSENFRDGSWDGKKTFYKNDTFSIGLLNHVKKKLEENKIEFELIDFDKFKNSIEIDETVLSNNLRKEQREGVVKFFENPNGFVTIPTRGGKTFLSAECIRLARLNGKMTSLFFVDSTDLFIQTIEQFSIFFKIPKEEIGQLQGENVLDFKEINVAMIQSFTNILFPTEKKKTKAFHEIYKKKFKLLKKIKQIEFLIIDEVQEFSSKNRTTTISLFNPVFKLALSATPFKSETEISNFCLREVVGEELFEVQEEELRESGSLVDSKVIIIFFEPKIDFSDSSYQNIYEELIVSGERRLLMISWIIKLLEKKKIKTLILVSRKKQGQILSKITNVPFVSGDDKQKERKNAKELFLDSEGGSLIASNIYNKGVSLNNCQILFNVASGLEQSSIIQKRGRVMAKVEGKDVALIIDIFDKTNYLSKHSLSRLEVYEEKTKKENIFVLDFEEDEFFENFEKVINETFRK